MELKKFIKTYNKEITILTDAIKVGIFITDEKGDVILVNSTSENTGGLSRTELLGKNMRQLKKSGYVTESCSLQAIESKKEESLIQKMGEGGQIYISATPIKKNEKEKIDIILCTERDITETVILKDLLKEKEEITAQYREELQNLKKENAVKYKLNETIITDNVIMKSIIANAIRVAKMDTTVLIRGESGTGKELFANLIYRNSDRINMPYVRINCAAIPENLLESEFFGYEPGSFTGADKKGKIGILESANGGTLFLDEIADLPVLMQAKLLRALQEKEIVRIGGKASIPIDVRIISATNKDLEKEILKNNFREDLYYRLNVFPVETIPLRDRKEDIELLSKYFIGVFNAKYDMNKIITKEGISALMDYNWPGNVRELRNILERLMATSSSSSIGKFQILKAFNWFKKIPDESRLEEGHTLSELLEQYEERILASLHEQYGNMNKMAKALGVNKSTISRKIKKYNIK